MSRDPLGKRALFSQPSQQTRAPGAFDVTVHCSGCDASTTMSAPGFLVRQLPMWAWLPWRKHPNLMRCPACNELTWCAVSRAK
jgi:hypothetical protein